MDCSPAPAQGSARVHPSPALLFPQASASVPIRWIAGLGSGDDSAASPAQDVPGTSPGRPGRARTILFLAEQFKAREERKRKYADLALSVMYAFLYFSVVLLQKRPTDAFRMNSALASFAPTGSGVSPVSLDGASGVTAWLRRTVGDIWTEPVCGDGVCSFPTEFPAWGSELQNGCRRDCGTARLNGTQVPMGRPAGAWNVCERSRGACWFLGPQNAASVDLPDGDWTVVVAGGQQIPLAPLWEHHAVGQDYGLYGTYENPARDRLISGKNRIIGGLLVTLTRRFQVLCHETMPVRLWPQHTVCYSETGEPDSAPFGVDPTFDVASERLYDATLDPTDFYTAEELGDRGIPPGECMDSHSERGAPRSETLSLSLCSRFLCHFRWRVLGVLGYRSIECRRGAIPGIPGGRPLF